MSWDELRARLSHRAGVTVEGDRVVIRLLRRVLASGVVLGMGPVAYLLPIYLNGDAGSAWRGDPIAMVTLHVAAPLFLGVVALLTGRPALVVDDVGLRTWWGRIAWTEVWWFDYTWTGRDVMVQAVLAQDSPAVHTLPRWVRHLVRRMARRNNTVPPVRLPLAGTMALPVSSDELVALVTRGAQRGSRSDLADPPCRPRE